MKKILFLMMFALCASISNAQDQKESVVKLKNGIEIRGTIVEHTGTSVAIKDNNGDTFFYNLNEINSINGENAKQKQHTTTANTYVDSSKRRPNGKGYGGRIEAYGGYDILGDGAYDFSFNVINGYHFGPSFYMGAGVGVKISAKWDSIWDDYHDQYIVDVISMPVFLYCQYTFMKGRKVRPYISLGAGGSIAFTGLPSYDDYYYLPHGAFLEPSFGISVKLGASTALSFAISSQMVLVVDEFEFLGVGGKVGFSF